ncbi:MAG: PAS domain-containing protein [Proteobacteria bacterium]|nr:PAS domain-containing protein [Pseudomonadota bacterium]
MAYERVRVAVGGVPRREDVGLEQLKDLLGWEFFAEWLAPHSIVVRLSGAHIDYVLGSNVTGVNFFDKYRADQRALYSRFYGAIADHPCGGYTVRGVVVGGTERFQYHSIYLPLATRPNYVPIVGAVAITDFTRLAPAGKVGGAPDFQALSRLGVFDIGFGVPAGGLERIDIAAVAAGIEAAGDTTLDQEALEVRPLIGRPRSMR